MNRYQKWTGALLAASLLLVASYEGVQPTSAASPVQAQGVSQVSLTLNGKVLQDKGVLGSDSALISMKTIRDSLGLSVTYDAKTMQYTINRGRVTVELKPTPYGTVQAIVNGSTQYTDYEWQTTGSSHFVSVHLLTDFLGYHVQWDQLARTVGLTPLKLNDVSYTTGKIEENNTVTDISVQYPVITGLVDPAVQSSINQFFKDRAQSYAKESLTKSNGLGLGAAGSKNEFDSNYSVVYNRNGIISFRMLNYEFTGGAHGMSYLEGITMSLKDGKVLQLSDLLKDSNDYQTVINNKVAASLKSNPTYFGGFTSIGNKPEFYVKDEGIVVFFQLYQYLPYVSGFPEYYIPFSALLSAGSNPFAGQ